MNRSHTLKFYILLSVIMGICFSMTGQTVQKEERTITSFKKLKVAGLAVVYLSEGNSDKVKLEVSGMPITDVLTTSENDVLTITTNGNHSGESIRVEVEVKELSEIEIADAGEIYSESPINGDILTISTVDVGAAWLNVKADYLIVNMAGGDLDVSGKVDRMDVFYYKDSSRGTLIHQELKKDEINHKVNQEDKFKSK